MDTATRPIAASLSLSMLLHCLAFAAMLLIYERVSTSSGGVGNGVEIELISSEAVSQQQETSLPAKQGIATAAAINDAFEKNLQENRAAGKSEPVKSMVNSLATQQSAETVVLKDVSDVNTNRQYNEVEQARLTAAEGVSAVQVFQATSASQQQHSILELLHTRISENKNYPYQARRQRREGVSTVAFVLYPDGSVENARLLNSSQSRVLDHAALSAVNQIEPFTAAQNYIDQAKEFQIDVVFDLF